MTQVQRDLFTKRWRRPKVPTAKEFQIQIALINRLKLQGNKAVLWFHVPNGELREKRTAARLKAMGVLPGVADLQFLWVEPDGDIRILFLELKRKGEQQTEDQLHFEKLVRERGCDYQVADSIDGAVAILKANGILP
jgi:hypothetical protein